MAGRIIKTPQLDRSPNLIDYRKTCTEFDWSQARAKLSGLPDGGLNIAYEAIDSHLEQASGDKLALRWIGKKEQIQDFTYRDLAALTGRFASCLTNLGIQPGARIYSLAGRLPSLYVAAMGTLKAGCVFTPLFSAFGPEPIRSRMEIGEANVMLTTKALYRKKLANWWRELPSMRAVLLIDAQADECEPGCYSLESLMADADPLFRCVATQAEDMALLHFTSGTTGKPKGVVHVHQAVMVHKQSALYALDLHPEDRYWCTADPGWVTGTSYGIIAPLCLGVTMIVDEADFDAERWYRILQEQQISVWYTAPTAIRMLMKNGAELPQQYDLSALRFIASVGEPLNPEAVIWGNEVLGLPFHDNWWQTETGGIMIANLASQDIKPGSMGRPLPGIEAAILTQGEGPREEIREAMQIGELALKPGWPSMFRTYLHQEEKYQKSFSNGWYLSGDLAMKDSDGYFWFVGRADDLIKTSGHLIGPFEVESALLEHQAVAEAGVIGKPDPIAGEIVKAFVALKPGVEADEGLLKELLGFARKRLGSAVAPKEIVFRNNLPKTRSGKIMRRLLKARELGLPEGDTSTLESDE